MRPDVIGKIREQQSDLSAKFARQLLRELKPYVDNGKLSALEGYVNRPPTDIPEDEYKNWERPLVRTEVYPELERSVYASLIGYTDWVAGRMVRSGNHAVPTPAEINFTAIEQKYDAPPQALRRTVSLMHSQRNLPLLGVIKDGKFNPDPDEFQRWKDLYDWSREGPIRLERG